MIKDYRRKSLSRYINESKHEIDCINLNTKSCDNYITAKNISRYQKRKLESESKEQEKRARVELYNRWINEMQELIQEKELLIEYIKALRMRLHERCNIC